MSPGSPALAVGVCNGDLDAAFVNPSALLTQAYIGKGLFTEALPVRVLACYPSWDRFVIAIRPGAGISSLADIKARQMPVRVSIREDATHSTRVLLDQMLPLYGYTLADIETWGGSFQLNGPPGDPRRLAAIADGNVDIVFDEGIVTWLSAALDAGYQPLVPEEAILSQLEGIGWRRVPLPKERYPALKADSVSIDYSGWPLYTSESMSDDDAYRICAAIAARAGEIQWESSYTGLAQLAGGSEATPLEVPLHPGAERWYREQGYL
jgi:TRAP-type uncharacterized transport system substrate-binding protein